MGQFCLCSNSGCQNRDFLKGDRCPTCGAKTGLYSNAEANQLLAVKRNVQTQQGPSVSADRFRLCSNPECPNRNFLQTDTCPTCKAKTEYYDNVKANQLLAAKRAPQLQMQNKQAPYQAPASMDQFRLCSNPQCQNRDFLKGDACPTCGAKTMLYNNADANQLLGAKRAPQLQMQNKQALDGAPVPRPAPAVVGLKDPSKSIRKRAFSGVLIFLALLCLAILVNAPFATLDDIYQSSYTGDISHDWGLTITPGGNVAVGVFQPVLEILSVLILTFACITFLAPLTKISTKTLKWTGILGVILILFTIIEAIGISSTWTSDLADCAPGCTPYSWALATGFYSSLFFSIIFVIISFVGARVSSSASTTQMQTVTAR